MDLGRAVVDAERAQVREDPRDDRFIGDALAAQHLHAAVDDAPRRLGNDHLGAARFVQRELAAVEHPRAMPDRESRDVQVHLVVGEHESDAFVLADRLAECVPAPRVVDGDIVRAPRRAEPAHAMREPRRRQSDLRVSEALADLAEDIARRNAQIVEPHDTVAARKARVEAVHRALDDDAGRVHVRQEHRGAGIVGVAP